MQELEDLEILKKIMNNEISMEDVDVATKVRLIKLCAERKEKVEKKTEALKKKNQIAKECIEIINKKKNEG